MTLDVKIMQQLDKWAEQVSDKGDNEALRLINQIPDSSSSTKYVRSAYVKYYFQSKRDYKTKATIDSLDLFKKDI